MPFHNPNGERDYRILEDLIVDLVKHPGEFFMRDEGCEALVYVEEIDMILHVECKGVLGSPEVRREALRRKVEVILDHGGP